MSTQDWMRLIRLEFRRRKTVFVPLGEGDTLQRLHARLRRAARRDGLPWRFCKSVNAVMVIRSI